MPDSHTDLETKPLKPSYVRMCIYTIESMLELIYSDTNMKEIKVFLLQFITFLRSFSLHFWGSLRTLLTFCMPVLCIF